MPLGSKHWCHLLTMLSLTLALLGCGGGGGGDALSSAVSNVTAIAVDVATLSSADMDAISVPFISKLSQVVARQAVGSPVLEPKAGLISQYKTYNPAQIRAAYQLPPLPPSWSNLTAAQAAQYGAGQTIYILDAMHDPNIGAELAVFNAAFGLPACTTQVLPSTTALPLPSADPAKGCELLVGYTSSGALTDTPPVYSSGWAMEIALDVQWAHATAPLARIVLLEAASATNQDLIAAINLANAMGPGVVSMSFGARESSSSSSLDSSFSAANMTYLASTGDSGYGVSWPSASSKVLAVGGTSLNNYTSNFRDEVAWSNTGGGISQYITIPSYQNLGVPGLASPTYRNVADVSFNADPGTGQFTAVIPPDSSTINWYSIGGTSLSCPQWAGIVAITNAVRNLNGQGPLGLVHNLLYKKAISDPSFFSAIFKDIVSGSNGSAATAYYDIPTGLGSPNVKNFITLASQSATAPDVSPINVNGIVGSPISFTMAYTSPHVVTWDLSGAPLGMTISSTGLVAWAQPVVGTYAITVTATDTQTSLQGSAMATVKVTQSAVPVVESTTISGQTGKALSFQVSVTNLNPVTLSLSGDVPLGMEISPTSLLTWSQPVAGTYAVKVNATDTVTSEVGTGDIIVSIAATPRPKGPIITVPGILTGVPKKPLTALVGITDPDAKFVSVSLKGAPAGMSLLNAAQGVILNWARPVAGMYTVVVTAKDNKNWSSQASILMVIY